MRLIKFLLIWILALLGNEMAAAGLCYKARTTLEDIIEHIPEGELPASFVGLPELRVALGN